MIKFVYFDVGGVVIDDFTFSNKWDVMKKVMGVQPSFEKEFDELYEEYEHTGLCLSLKTDSLIPIFTQKFKMRFPKGFSMLEYFVDHFDNNRPIWPVISEINKTSKIGLLTNMYVDMLPMIFEKKILPPVKWDVIINSSIIKMQKPSKDIFEFAQKKACVDPQEILFIDNKFKNTETAKALGWQTFFYDSMNYKKSSQDLLKFYLNTQKQLNLD